jgi:hypothetical protein
MSEDARGPAQADLAPAGLNTPAKHPANRTEAHISCARGRLSAIFRVRHLPQSQTFEEIVRFTRKEP